MRKSETIAERDLKNQANGQPPSGVYLDSEVVDSIALRSLRWHYWSILQDIEDFEKNERGHPDDFDRNISLKYHFEKVLEYYGN